LLDVTKIWELSEHRLWILFLYKGLKIKMEKNIIFFQKKTFILFFNSHIT